MSLLFEFDELPDVYEQNGKTYRFHSDYREWMRFETLITDSDVPEKMKTVLALRLIFPHELPPDIISAVKFLLYFYRCGTPPRETENKTGIILSSRHVYSFEYDGEYIFAAFLEQYGIDLSDIKYMHWWKFHALFKGLHDCKLTDIMGYRSADISDDLPDSRKAFLLDMQELYALPVSLTEQREIDAAKRFLEGV